MGDADVVPCEMPAGDELHAYLNAWGLLCAPEAVDAHRGGGWWPAQKERYGTCFKAFLEQGEAVSGTEYAAARILRDKCVGKINAMFVEYNIDVLACPAWSAPPFRYMNAHKPDLLLTDRLDIRDSIWGRHTIPFDYSGHPTITLPCGVTQSQGCHQCARSGCPYAAHVTQGQGFCCVACKDDDGHGPACEFQQPGEAQVRPLVFQLVAKRLDEQLLCQLGHQYEAAMGRQRTPMLPASVLKRV